MWNDNALAEQQRRSRGGPDDRSDHEDGRSEHELSSRPHVVIVGGGFGGLAAAKKLGSKDVRVTLYDRSNYHLFQPLLYQVALASLGESDIAVPIRSILREHQNIDVILGEVNRVDLAARRVHLENGDSDSYDYLILAGGALTNYYGHQEWAEWAQGLKNLDDALEVRRRVLLAFEAADRASSVEERERLLTFAVIGAGPTGVELAGAIADLSCDILNAEYRHLRGERARVILLETASRILGPMPPKLSESAAQQLQSMGVVVRTNVQVSSIDEQGVRLGDELVPAATVLWGAGVLPNPLAKTLGVPLDRAGRVPVGEDCSLPGHPEVFVIGDMAAFKERDSDKPLPALSPVALQQGRAVAANVLRELRGMAREPFAYRDRGFMATIGRARAVSVIYGRQLSGFLAWLAWALLHLWYLVGFRSRLSVFLNWIWAYLMSKHGARVITGPSEVRVKDLSAVTDARRSPEDRPVTNDEVRKNALLSAGRA